MIKKQKAILCANHQSNWDPVLLKLRIDAGSKVMGKHTLFKGGLGWFLRSAGGYPVNRETSDVQAVKITLTHLKNDQHVVIFPEGTRIEDEGDIGEVKNGVVMFALKTDCYILPMYFINKPKTFKINKLVVGEPFKFSDFKEFQGVKPTKEVLNSASKVLTAKINELQHVDLKTYNKNIKNKYKITD